MVLNSSKSYLVNLCLLFLEKCRFLKSTKMTISCLYVFHCGTILCSGYPLNMNLDCPAFLVTSWLVILISVTLSVSGFLCTLKTQTPKGSTIYKGLSILCNSCIFSLFPPKGDRLIFWIKILYPSALFFGRIVWCSEHSIGVQKIWALSPDSTTY